MKAFNWILIVIFSFLYISVCAPVIAQTAPQITLKEVKPVDGGKIQSTVTWNSTSSQNHYYEVYSKTGTAEYSLLGNIKDSPVVLTYPEETEFFNIKVREITSQGASSYSNEVYVQWARTQLKAPTNINIQNIKTTDNTVEAIVKWNAVTKAVKYYIYTIVDNKKQKIGETNTLESPIAYSKYGSAFAVAVTAVNSLGESELSTLLQINREQYVTPTTNPTPTSKTIPELTSAPTNIHIVSQIRNDNTKDIELVWNSLPASVGYYVYVSTEGEFTKLTGVTINSIVLTVPADFVPFKVAVSGVNQKGESPRSEALEIKDEDPKIQINLQNTTQITPVISVTPSPKPEAIDILNQIEVKEGKPPNETAAVLGLKDSTKQDQSVVGKIASFVTSVLQFFTNFWK